MVLFGGLEIVAAGYLIHKHKQNKRERERLEEEAAALTEQQYPLQESSRLSRPHRRHSHSDLKDLEDEERRERRRRRRSRERREREKMEFEEEARLSGGRQSAPPGNSGKGTGRYYAPPLVVRPAQVQVEPGVVAGWPAHWKQSHTPPTPPPPTTPARQRHEASSSQYNLSRPQAPAQYGPNEYPPDIKYGFVPEIPHEQYPSYPPPPFEERAEGSGKRRRAETLEVRGRDSGRRSASPRLGLREEGRRSQVRFSEVDEVLGEQPPRYRP